MQAARETGLWKRGVLWLLLLGPLFIPISCLCGGISVRNRFERAADHYAMHGHGWWPWGSNRNAS